MATYSGTTDPDIVNKEEVLITQIDLQQYIDEFLSIKGEYLAMPKLKLTPDVETLNYYNTEIGNLNESRLAILKTKAIVLYNELQPINDAGLLPAKYITQYNQLVAFINS